MNNGAQNGEPVFVLKMNEEQARIVSKACEFYARVIMGQFCEIADATMLSDMDYNSTVKIDEEWYARRDMAVEALNCARRRCYPELTSNGMSYGIGHSKTADKAYNIHQVLRYEMSQVHHPEGGSTTGFLKPYDLTGVGMPTCIVEESI